MRRISASIVDTATVFPVERHAEAPTAAEVDGTAIGRRALVSLLLVVAAGASLSLQRAPRPHTAVAASEFSTARAMQHVQAIASAPRPLGSPGHAAAEAYLQHVLIGIGVAPQVQEAIITDAPSATRMNIARVRNVLGRINGQVGSPAVLLAGHYDSTSVSPGAADNAAGVATLLETARALRVGPPLKHDVIVLFTDAEEMNQQGARAFVEQHAWAGDVGVVLNFDARGSSGPVLMFETGPGNADLIAAYQRAARHPVASSLFPEVYRFMPNTTDFSIFRRAGLSGLNFANIEGVANYHTATDRAERLDEQTLQHFGDSALDMARSLASRGLPLDRSRDAVYFNPFGTWLISYPGRWTLPSTALVVLICVIVVARAGRRLDVTWRGSARAAAVSLLVLGASFAVGRGVSALWIAAGRRGSDALYLGSASLLLIAVYTIADRLLLRRLSSPQIAIGHLVWSILVLGGLSIFAPGAAYLPLVLVLSALAVVIGALMPSESSSSALQIGAAAIAAAIVTPVVWLVFEGLGTTALAEVLLLEALLLAALVSPLRFVMGQYGWKSPVLVTTAGIALLGAAVVSAQRVSPTRVNHLFYVLEADSGQAVWASLDPGKDAWVGRFVSGPAPALLQPYLTTRRGTWLQGPAPAAPLAAPTVTLSAITNGEAVSQRTFTVVSNRSGPLLSIHLAGNITRVSVSGRDLTPTSHGINLPRIEVHYRNAPPSGVELTVETRGDQPLSITAIDTSYGLVIPGIDVPPRPSGVYPNTAPLSDTTIVAKSYTFASARLRESAGQ